MQTTLVPAEPLSSATGLEPLGTTPVSVGALVPAGVFRAAGPPHASLGSLPEVPDQGAADAIRQLQERLRYVGSEGERAVNDVQAAVLAHSREVERTARVSSANVLIAAEARDRHAAAVAADAQQAVAFTQQQAARLLSDADAAATRHVKTVENRAKTAIQQAQLQEQHVREQAKKFSNDCKK